MRSEAAKERRTDRAESVLERVVEVEAEVRALVEEVDGDNVLVLALDDRNVADQVERWAPRNVSCCY